MANTTSITPQIIDLKGDESAELSCGITLDEYGEDFNPVIGKASQIALFRGGDVENIIVKTTNGTISKKSSDVSVEKGVPPQDGSDYDKIYLTFEGEASAELPYIYSSGFKIEDTVGTIFDLNGNETSVTLTLPSQRSTTVYANKPCYGVFQVSFSTICDVYEYTPDEEGEAIILALGTCGDSRVKDSMNLNVEEDSGSSSSCCCCSSCCSSAIQKVSIKVIYKDFVTGEPVAGVAVSVDGKNVGVTADDGSITINDVQTNQSHSIKGTKPGYLDTDSDSLANDQFVIS